MSIKATSLVWERTRAKGSNLLMLLAIADYAKDDGRGAFVSARTLTWKSRLSGRAGELVLAKLVEDGEIEPEWVERETRLYLHVRCVYDWVRYQAEGPVPQPDPERRRVRENFARKLMARFAKFQAADLSRRDTLRENGDTLGEKSCKHSISCDPIDPLDPSSDPARAAQAEGPDALVALWNTTTTEPLPRVAALTSKRRILALARLRERPDLDWWREVFVRVERSAFCRGAGAKGWICRLSWLLDHPDHAVQVLEGQYDDPVRERPFTERELAAAARVRASWFGRCQHDPTCADYQACLATIMRHWRATGQAV